MFAMPQSGTGVSVEAVDPVFQTKMLDMLKQTGRRACAATAPACHAPRAGCIIDTLCAVLEAGSGCVTVSLASRTTDPQMTVFSLTQA